MRQLLTVFLASPSDLGRERMLARDVVDEINTSIREINWSIELLGWEDTLPGYGRPQSLINADVEQCQLFIGMLWRRWGTAPDDTGEFTSGFEEEFALARTLKEKNAAPEICMFFKKVEPEQLNDPGTQLLRLMRFRDEIARGRICLFKEFADELEWRQLLSGLLLRHILKLNKLEQSPPLSTAVRPHSQPPSAPGDMGTTAASAAGQQLEELARALAPCFRTGDLRDVETGALLNLNFFAARTWLLAHGASKVVDGALRPVATHELNTLYCYRQHLRATDAEMEALFETMLEDSATVAPGWFWLKTAGDQEIESLLFRTLFTVENYTVRKTVLNMLRFSEDNSLSGERRILLERELSQYRSELHDAAWTLLVHTATMDDLETLAIHASDSWIGPRLKWLAEWVACGRDLESFLTGDDDLEFFPAATLKEMILAIPVLSTAAIQRLTALRSTNILRASISELKRRGVHVAEEVRAAALSSNLLLSQLNNAKHGTGESDESMYTRLCSQTTDALAQSIIWTEIESAVAYQILIERGSIDRETVRIDITNGFKRLHESFAQEWLELCGEEGHKLVARLDTYRDLIVTTFSEKALKGLALNPTPEDAPIARKMLSEFGTRSSAMRILALAGSKQDLGLLVKAAETCFGDERARALAAVSRINNDARLTFDTLFSSDSIELKRFAVWLLPDIRERDAREISTSLLLHSDEQVRLGAVVYLGKILPRLAAEQLLDRYLQNDKYYYNVVTWLDRFVYAPRYALRAYLEQINCPRSELDVLEYGKT